MVSASPTSRLASRPDKIRQNEIRQGLADALGLHPDDIAPAPVPGRVHDHWPLPEGRLARVAGMSHLGLPPVENLAYAESAFRRGLASGSVPTLFEALPVSEALPWGALIVENVEGAAPVLPRDLPAIARALGAIHALDLPTPAESAPLIDPDDPIGYLVDLAEGQWAAGDPATIAPEAASIVAEELAWARDFRVQADAEGRTPPKVLAFADTHPGNFRIRPDGSAVLLDVERPVYDCAGLDLAHASLPTSLTWDAKVHGGETVTAADLAAFEAAWTETVPDALALATQPWLIPYRRLVWLRTTTWAAKFRATLGPDHPLAPRLTRFTDPAVMRAAMGAWSD